MITYNNSQTRLRLVAVVLLAAAAAGGAYWWSGSDKHDGVVLSEEGKGLPGWPQASTGVPSPEAVLTPSVMADGRPSDVSQEDWDILKAIMAKQPNGQGQAERIVSLLRYQNAFEAWQGIEDSKDKQAYRRNMAKSLLADLPERLTNGEFTLVETTLMAAILIADIESDEDARNQALSQWQAKLNAIEPPTEDERLLTERSKPVELKRMQATAFAEWKAQTNPAERTPAKLEQAMQEVLRSYNSGGK